ncbi:MULTISPECIES: Ger(x)C family spore germination protein [Bacillaceae]|uniref:Spore gernimation protein n=1 Tax=Gottfriedia luciferensis TaxID=178774 RepID=A0ABX2ZLF1_9BACI|nr:MULTISPECIES: Ger(x)C family spore germination protein [Bacillaceae]ODG90056.1 spore gernimation protein [Gottfriedia luciferensis]PGZ91669.1 Ger(x)C family spore germination protein [Bacillus sp. AFS029533]
MSKHKLLCMMLIVSLFFLTGCWDRTELNDLAIELGLGLDQAKNNKLEVSAQFIIPSMMGMGQSGRSDSGKPFFIESGTGRDTLEAVQKMQTKLSREVFRGHHRVILIGEPLARQGLANVLDNYSRDPDIRLRADALVVKGSSAKEFLEASSPLENIPAIGAQKEHAQSGGLGDSSLVNFLIAGASDGINPILPVIKLISSSNDQDQPGVKEFQYVGGAVFNKDLKLIGYLNNQEESITLWVANRLSKQTITETVPQGNGNASLYMTKIASKIKPSIHGNTIKCDIVLSGEGTIQENNTNLDITQPKNLTFLEHVLEKKVEKQALQTIGKVQKQFGTDIFGLGEAIHQSNPSKWKVLKKEWDKQFSKVQVSVHAKLTIRRVGLTGPSLQVKQNEIKK